MRRAASLLALAALLAVPATGRAQVITTTPSVYTGCTLYLCAHLDRTDIATIGPGAYADFRYSFTGYVEILQPTVDAGYTQFWDGLIRYTAGDYIYDIGVYLPLLDFTGLQAGDRYAIGDGSQWFTGPYAASDFAVLQGALMNPNGGGVDVSSALPITGMMTTMTASSVQALDASFLPTAVPLTRLAAPATVPEPATLALVGTGLFAVATGARRRRAV